MWCIRCIHWHLLLLQQSYHNTGMTYIRNFSFQLVKMYEDRFGCHEEPMFMRESEAMKVVRGPIKPVSK